MYKGQEIQEVAFDTSLDLWDAIRPEKLQESFIFRGQRDSSWELNTSNSRLKGMRFGSLNSCLDEMISICDFVKYCDQQGLSFYGDSINLREQIEPSNNILKVKERPPKDFFKLKEWPPKNIIPLLSLCQHHGVKTRLLDWTKRAHVAAYFAAATAIEYLYELSIEDTCRAIDYLEDKRVAIWSFDKDSINLSENIHLQEVPGCVSVNLAAQSGVLMYLQEKIEPSENFSREPLNNYIPAKDCSLVKYTLPVKESLNILKLCEAYNVTTATMFPGYDGVAKMVEQKRKIKYISYMFDFR